MTANQMSGTFFLVYFAWAIWSSSHDTTKGGNDE